MEEEEADESAEEAAEALAPRHELSVPAWMVTSSVNSEQRGISIIISSGQGNCLKCEPSHLLTRVVDLSSRVPLQARKEYDESATDS